ncbi:MAG: hypothetical protein HPPSJP_3160 [Candidatus Hepatoplasma scabrum]|nr:MAG: hypothetical protein HPPSJP_3160 [Candidatus Hepatoplasma sp.]
MAKIINKDRFVYRIIMAILFTIGFLFWTIILFLPDDILNIGMNNTYYAWFSLNTVFLIERWFLIIPNERNFKSNEAPYIEKKKKKEIIQIELPIAIISTILVLFWFLIQLSQSFDNSWIFAKGDINCWPSLTFSTIILYKRWSIITDYSTNPNHVRRIRFVVNLLLSIAFLFWTAQLIAYQLSDYDKLAAGFYPWTLTTGIVNVSENIGVYWIDYKKEK